MYLQALNQLEVARHVERMALDMRLDAMRTLKSVFAGTTTSHFTDVIEAVFGVEEENPPPETEETEETEDRGDDVPDEGLIDKDAAGTVIQPSTSSQGTKHKTNDPPKQKSKRKSSKPTKAGICKLEDATPLYPTDEATYLHTGVPSKYISSRKGSQYKNTAVYICNYAQAMAEEGKSVAPCDVMCQQKAQTSSHIRQFHLGNCIVCYICGHRWWLATEWGKHMAKVHSALSPEDYYVKADFDPTTIAIKTEVTEADL